MKEKTYEYSIYKIYEIDEKDTEEVMRTETEQELTLCTCTFDKTKRLIIKTYYRY